jgi:tryptophan synthase alpha chain
MIKQAFKKRKSLFIPFVMMGAPSLECSIQAILELESVGADMIEIGVPFSDPVADGPIILQAAEIALRQGITLAAILDSIKHLRLYGCKVPLILFSYLNPILAYGFKSFAEKSKEVGVDGVLIVDLPPEEGQPFYTIIEKLGIDCVLLISPTTQVKRFDHYKRLNPGFLYVISRLGVTGLQSRLDNGLSENIHRINTLLPGIKTAIGFGISNVDQACEAASYADGVIVGSLLVDTLNNNGLCGFRHCAMQLAKGIHGGSL